MGSSSLYLTVVISRLAYQTGVISVVGLDPGGKPGCYSKSKKSYWLWAVRLRWNSVQEGWVFEWLKVFNMSARRWGKIENIEGKWMNEVGGPCDPFLFAAHRELAGR